MATKKQLANWGSILALIGGILEVAVGVLMLIGGILESILDIFNKSNWLGPLVGNDLVSAIILIVVGVIVILIAIGRFGLNYTVIAIIFIILGIIGSSLAALLILIGGILYLIAALK